jgi:hypothetical protein
VARERTQRDRDERDLIPLTGRTEEERQALMMAWRLGLELEVYRTDLGTWGPRTWASTKPPDSRCAYRIKRRE